jgi:AbrB family looped-hinge helix DNA binding protein
MTTTMTSKGQVTIPKPIRDFLGLAPGSQVAFDYGPDGQVILRPAGRAHPRRSGRSRFARLRGTGTYAGMTTDQLMNLLRGYDGDARDPGLR